MPKAAAKPSGRAKKTVSNGRAAGRSSGASQRAAASRAAADAQPVRALLASRAFAQTGLSGDLQLRVGEEVSLTHLDRVYWPADGLTKGDLVRYYWHVADVLLPHLKDRPLILKRYPNGIDQAPFFQHDVDVKKLPGFVHTFTTVSEEGRSIDYVLCQNRATLLYLANLGTIAMNPWNSRVGTIDRPDWMVFDLDPGRVAFRVVCDVALAVRDALGRAGLTAYANTSGSRGLHLYVPLKLVHPYEQVAQFAAQVARQVAAERSDIATVERSKQKRPADKVYVDFLQNARGKSVASAYSVREHPGAAVSAPLDWSEVEACPDLAQFNIHTMPGRLEEKGDLFKPVLKRKQSLPAGR
jgi:bifunctional non-homologous end joining protein LigD